MGTTPDCQIKKTRRGECSLLKSNMQLCTFSIYRTRSNQDVGRQVLERSRKRKQNRPSKFQPTPLPLNSKIVTNNSTGLGSPTKKVRKVGECGDIERSQTEILFLLEKKKKLVKKDGLYKFVLWREALREEKNKVCL